MNESILLEALKEIDTVIEDSDISDNPISLFRRISFIATEAIKKFEDSRQGKIDKGVGESNLGDSRQRQSSQLQDSSGKETGMNWVKASEIKIDYKKIYFAKWLLGYPKGGGSTGRFQESDNTLFWREQGIEPVHANELDDLLILDESVHPYKEPLKCKDTTTGKIVYAYHIDEGAAAHNKSNTKCIGCIGVDLIPVTPYKEEVDKEKEK